MLPSLVAVTSTPRVMPATSIQPVLALARSTGGRGRGLPVAALGWGEVVVAVAVVDRTTTSAAANEDDEDDCDGVVGRSRRAWR